jgi:hypothetical protein
MVPEEEAGSFEERLMSFYKYQIKRHKSWSLRKQGVPDMT